MKNARFGIAVMAGAAIGYAASLFVSPSTRRKHKRIVTANIEELASKFLSEADQEKILKIIEKTGKEGSAQLKVISESLSKNLVELKQTLDSVDKGKYLKAVETTIKDLKNKGELNQKQLNQLKDYLVNDFRQVSSEVKAKK